MLNTPPAKTSLEAAIDAVLANLKEMPADVLRAKLAENANGPISRMAEDAAGFAEFLETSETPAAVQFRAMRAQGGTA